MGLGFLGSIDHGRCDVKLRLPFLTQNPTPRLRIVSQEVKCCIFLNAEGPFVSFFSPVTFHSLKRHCMGN